MSRRGGGREENAAVPQWPPILGERRDIKSEGGGRWAGAEEREHQTCFSALVSHQNHLGHFLKTSAPRLHPQSLAGMSWGGDQAWVFLSSSRPLMCRRCWEDGTRAGDARF